MTELEKVEQEKKDWEKNCLKDAAQKIGEVVS